MAIITGDQYIASKKQIVPINKTTVFTTVGTALFSTLDVAGTPGAGSLTIGNTTTGLIPDDGTAGFPMLNAFGVGNKGYISRVAFTTSVIGTMQLWDRLWHAGSITATALATTTFSGQPSFASRLPNSSYNGLFILLEINTAFSATATTVSVSYTNQNGTAGRTTGATASLSAYSNKRVITMPLQSGDSGVQKIDSVTVGGVVATAGTFNVIIARPLLLNMNSLVAGSGDTFGIDRTGMVEVFETSALWLTIQPNSTSSGLQLVGIEVAVG